MRRARWRWGGVIALAVTAAVALALVADGDDGPAATTTTVPGRLQEAVLRADVAVAGVDADDVRALVEDLCVEKDGAALGRQVVSLGVTDRDTVRELVEGVGRGANSYCPEVPAESPGLINEAYNAALAELDG